MTPEIAAKYQDSYRYWQQQLGNDENKRIQDAKPLVFDIPENTPGDFGYFGYFPERYLTESRLYFGGQGDWRSSLYKIYAVGFVMAGMGLLMTLTNIFQGEAVLTYEWLLLIISLIVSLWSYYTYKRRPRLNNHAFDRETGKIYLAQGKDKPHLVVDFYEQYFFTVGGIAGAMNEFGSLMMRPRVRDEKGELQTYPPFSVALGGGKGDGLLCWYALLRFMDKSIAFNQDELKLVSWFQAWRKTQRYKIQGIHWPDGTVEWL